MVRNIIGVSIFCLLAFALTWGFSPKKDAAIVPLTAPDMTTLAFSPRFATAEACTVRHDDGAYWLIQHWVTGAELYKSYQDPSLACTGPYPFTVQDIEIVLYFDRKCTLYVSVDVESADLSTPSCPGPGNLLSISSEYSYIIPGQGLYLLAVPLDSVAVVNGPYFAGFYISNVLDSTTGAALVTDSIPALCAGYNIWDTSIGYIDLGDNAYYDFPGRLLLFSSGLTGGSGGQQPEPSVTLLKPAVNEIVSGAAKLWASENSGSTIIDSVRFDQRSTGSWVRIGRDSDGARALRDGANPSGTGDGYALDWNYGGLSEGAFWLKATAYDTLGRIDIDSHQVAIDPTPPDLNMTDLNGIDSICPPMKLSVTTSDENVTQVKFEKKAAPTNYSIALTPLNQSKYGNYYCGPVAGAIAVKYWFDKGYLYCMRESGKYISVDTVVARLADLMQTKDNSGTYDDLFFGGLLQYIATHGNELLFDIYRRPDYALFRTLFQERELVALLALSGTPGIYLPVSGVSGLLDTQGRFAITVCNPLTGAALNTYMRNSVGGAQVYFGGNWLDLDMIITVKGYSLNVTRDLIGTDNSSADGWNIDLPTTGLTKDSLYFITATATDATGRIGTVTSLDIYYCPAYLKADYDGNGLTNIGDALYLINYIYKGGPAPIGGAGRADANCNGDVDITDVVFVIKYVYSGGTPPCY